MQFVIHFTAHTLHFMISSHSSTHYHAIVTVAFPQLKAKHDNCAQNTATTPNCTAITPDLHGSHVELARRSCRSARRSRQLARRSRPICTAITPIRTAITPDLHGDHARLNGDHAMFAIHQFRSINFTIKALSNALSAREPPSSGA
jgi:hypothetical protein